MGCSAAKARAPRGVYVPARELYTGPLFRKARQLAESPRFAAWAILSARWGLVLPETELEPYEWGMRDWNARERECWAGRVATDARRRWPGADFWLFAGRLYVDELARRLPGACTPLAGLGIGQQLQWLDLELLADTNRQASLF